MSYNSEAVVQIEFLENDAISLGEKRYRPLDEESRVAVRVYREVRKELSRRGQFTEHSEMDENLDGHFDLETDEGTVTLTIDTVSIQGRDGDYVGRVDVKPKDRLKSVPKTVNYAVALLVENQQMLGDSEVPESD